MPQFLDVPPGVVRDVASYIYHAAPYPNETIATVAAVGFVAAIVGRSHNVSGTGLNQYLLTVAPTGTGKEQGPDGIGRLLAPLEAAFPALSEIRGPGEIVSAPGLHKALAIRRNPSMLCIIGEAGLMLAQLASPKRDTNKAGIERFMLHVYTKSGFGAVLDDAAYSDKQNNPGVVNSPALSIVGDTTPETFYSALDRRMILSGLLPRFTIFETTAPRPYQNKDRVFAPCPHLIERLKRLSQIALELQGSKRVCEVGMTEDAAVTFDQFEHWTTDKVNDAANELTRHLWTRVYLKALKLAALNAVGVDPLSPRITYAESMWATNVIVDQTNALIAKFDSGEIGEAAGNELLQQDRVRMVMRECAQRPFDEIKGQFGGTPEMHGYGLVTHQYLQRRLLNLPLFKDDPIKATPALKRTIQSLCDNAEIEVLSGPKAKTTFGHGFLSYRFAEYNPNNEVERAKNAVFFVPNVGGVLQGNMK